MGIRLVIFDWDGTLVDTTKIAYEIYEKIARVLGKNVLSFDTFMSLYNENHDMFFSLLGVVEEEAGRIPLLYQEIYHALNPSPLLMPHTKEVLSRLAQERIALALVSNGRKWRVHRELATTQLASFFTVVITREDVPHPKPDPTGIMRAIETCGCAPYEALVVGDREEDMEAGKRAGAHVYLTRYPSDLVHVLSLCDVPREF